MIRRSCSNVCDIVTKSSFLCMGRKCLAAGLGCWCMFRRVPIVGAEIWWSTYKSTAHGVLLLSSISAVPFWHPSAEMCWGRFVHMGCEKIGKWLGIVAGCNSLAHFEGGQVKDVGGSTGFCNTKYRSQKLGLSTRLKWSSTLVVSRERSEEGTGFMLLSLSATTISGE